MTAMSHTHTRSDPIILLGGSEYKAGQAENETRRGLADRVFEGRLSPYCEFLVFFSPAVRVSAERLSRWVQCDSTAEVTAGVK